MSEPQLSRIPQHFSSWLWPIHAVPWTCSPWLSCIFKKRTDLFKQMLPEGGWVLGVHCHGAISSVVRELPRQQPALFCNHKSPRLPRCPRPSLARSLTGHHLTQQGRLPIHASGATAVPSGHCRGSCTHVACDKLMGLGESLLPQQDSAESLSYSSGAVMPTRWTVALRLCTVWVLYSHF